MNFAASTKNIRFHFWIPVTSLVTEMNAGFEQLTHGNVCHDLNFLYLTDSHTAVFRHILSAFESRG